MNRTSLFRHPLVVVIGAIQSLPAAAQYPEVFGKAGMVLKLSYNFKDEAHATADIVVVVGTDASQILLEAMSIAGKASLGTKIVALLLSGSDVFDPLLASPNIALTLSGASIRTAGELVHAVQGLNILTAKKNAAYRTLWPGVCLNLVDQTVVCGVGAQAQVERPSPYIFWALVALSFHPQAVGSCMSAVESGAYPSEIALIMGANNFLANQCHSQVIIATHDGMYYLREND